MNTATPGSAKCETRRWSRNLGKYKEMQINPQTTKADTNKKVNTACQLLVYCVKQGFGLGLYSDKTAGSILTPGTSKKLCWPQTMQTALGCCSKGNFPTNKRRHQKPQLSAEFTL